MLEWFLAGLISTAIGGACRLSQKREKDKWWKKHLEEQRQWEEQKKLEPPKPTPRYKNTQKQFFYEEYLRDLEKFPDYAKAKIRHNLYGGYIFDDTEN